MASQVSCLCERGSPRGLMIDWPEANGIRLSGLPRGLTQAEEDGYLRLYRHGNDDQKINAMLVLVGLYSQTVVLVAKSYIQPFMKSKPALDILCAAAQNGLQQAIMNHNPQVCGNFADCAEKAMKFEIELLIF